MNSTHLGGVDYPIHPPGVLPEAGQLLGLDVESTYMGALGQWSPGFAVRLIQLSDGRAGYRVDPSQPDQLARFAELASRSDFVSHTSMDVLSLSVSLGIDIVWRNIDTRMLARMVDGSKTADNDLKSLVTKHIGPELAAAETELIDLFRGMWPGKKNAKLSDIEAHGWANVAIDDPVFTRYAVLDAIAVRRLAEVLVPLTQAPAALLDTEVWLARRAVDIQLRGMRVDTDALDAFEADAVARTDAPRAVIVARTGLPAGSPKLPDWLTGEGVRFVEEHPLTPGGAYQMTAESVALLDTSEASAPGIEVVEAISAFKRHQDALTRAKGVREHLAADGLVHPTLHSIGAVTARMSSAGPNFQNFSKRDPRARGLFIPRPGYVFLTADFDQVELRVVAALARENKMISTILDGGDLHQLTVDELAGVGITVTRDIGKMTNFLIVYGGGGKALHEQAGIPLAEAQQIVRAHRERYPAIQALTERLGRSTTAIRTISGRRIPVKYVRGVPASYANINYLVQSSARDLLVHSWLRLCDRSPFGDMVWFLVHDEMILEVPEAMLVDAQTAVQRAMTFDFLGVPISATAVPLIDEHGQSRWMTSKLADHHAEVRASMAERVSP